MAINNPPALWQNLSYQHPQFVTATLATAGLSAQQAKGASDDVLRMLCKDVQNDVKARWGHWASSKQAIAKSILALYSNDSDAAFAYLKPYLGRTWMSFYNGEHKPGNLKVGKDADDALRDLLRRNRPEEGDAPATEEVKPPFVPAEVKPPTGGSSTLRADTELLIKWVAGVREWQISIDKDGWGYRQVKKGVALLGVGFPLAGVKDAFTIDFPAEIRRAFGVTEEFDVIGWGRTIATEGENALKAALRRLATAPEVNVATVGGPGIGKTHTTSEILREDYDHHVVVSCNPNTAGADFYGFLTPMMEFSDLEKGFRLSEFAKALIASHEGKRVAILLDEMDALEPGVAIALNRALENGEMGHRFLGEPLDTSRVMFYGAMNSVGLGATADYTARERQDAAFLDRFVRVRVKFDAAVERSIAEEMLAQFGA